jgi:hypothetical protein
MNQYNVFVNQIKASLSVFTKYQCKSLRIARKKMFLLNPVASISSINNVTYGCNIALGDLSLLSTCNVL